MENDSKKTEWPRLDSRVLDKKYGTKPKPVHKSVSFRRWFCNSVVRLCEAVAERKRLSRADDAAEKRLRDFRQKHLRKAMRGTATIQERIAYLRNETAFYNAESNLAHAYSNLCDIVRLTREEIVQAWQRHTDRAVKRYADAPDTERHRIMCEIAGLYGVFCLVDDFDIVRGSMNIDFVYDEVAKARRKFERLGDSAGFFEDVMHRSGLL
jgi:hypothetical protein